MIKQEAKEALKLLGLNVDELIEAVKAEEEKEITIPKSQLFTEETLTARDANKITEGKKLGVEEGKRAGFDIANKLMIDQFGLKDVEKSAEPIKIVEAAKAALQTGDAGLKQQIELLKSSVTEWEGKYKTIESEKQKAERNSQLLGYLPKNRSSVLTDSEYINILQSNIEEVDGKLAVKLNGEVLRDEKTKDVLPLNVAIGKVFESRNNWLDTEANPKGGRGAGDVHGGGTGGIKRLSQAVEKFKSENPDKTELSPEFTTYLAEATKDVKDFDFNS